MADNAETPIEKTKSNPKPGIQTTEFWAAVATVTPILITTFQSAEWPVQVAGIVAATVIAVAYMVTRWVLKVPGSGG